MQQSFRLPHFWRDYSQENLRVERTHLDQSGSPHSAISAVTQGDETWLLFLFYLCSVLGTQLLISQLPYKAAILLSLLQMKKLKLRDGTGWPGWLMLHLNRILYSSQVHIIYCHSWSLPVVQWSRDGFPGPSFLICRRSKLDKPILEDCLNLSKILYWHFGVFWDRKYDSLLGETPFGCFQKLLLLAEIFKQDVDRFT